MNVILKFDDMMYPLDQSWQRCYDLLLKYCMKANFGFIVDQCDENINLNFDLIELWFHGKTHLVNITEKDVRAEFYKTGLEYQRSSFYNSLYFLSKYNVSVFGAATNQIDEDTIILLNDIDEIKSVCFCTNRQQKLLNKKCYTIQNNLLNFWNSRKTINCKKIGTTDSVDFKKFINNLNSFKSIPVVPFHPSLGPWNERSFFWFEQLLIYLKNNNVEAVRFQDN